VNLFLPLSPHAINYLTLGKNIREQIRTGQAGSNSGGISGGSVSAGAAATASPSGRYTPSPTLRGNTPSPGPNEDIAALQGKQASSHREVVVFDYRAHRFYFSSFLFLSH
jgi:hypothetical protein